MDNSLFCEYVVKPPKGYLKLRRRKILFISLYIAYCLVYAALILFTKLVLFVIPVTVAAAAVLWVIILFSWRHTRPEYEYSVMAGIITFSTVFGGRSRRTEFETVLTDAVLVAPLDNAYTDRLRDYAPECEYCGVFDMSSPDAYFMLFENEDEKKSVFYFEADEKTIKLIRRVCGRTVPRKY